MEKGTTSSFPLSEIIIGTVFFIFGLLFYVESKKIASGFMQVIGADMYPKTIALGLMICSGLYIIKIMNLYKSGMSFSTEKNNFQGTWEQARSKLAAMWILLIAYVYFVRLIGYFETGFIFLALSMFFLGERDSKWLVSSLGISAVITFFSYLVFVKLLNTYLPSGILFKM